MVSAAAPQRFGRALQIHGTGFICVCAGETEPLWAGRPPCAQSVARPREPKQKRRFEPAAPRPRRLRLLPPGCGAALPALPATESRQRASCQRRSRAGAAQGRLPARIAAADNTGVDQINTGVRCQLGDRRCAGAPAVKRRGIRGSRVTVPRLHSNRGSWRPGDNKLLLHSGGQACVWSKSFTICSGI